MSIYRVFAGADGESHIEEIDLDKKIIHLRGEVEIGVSDGNKQIFRPGDARLMEDTSGPGHIHQDLSPVIQAVVVLED